jgi:6-pyruvoyltetrahydropterin/6-carboxytetrahydropterin synthase
MPERMYQVGTAIEFNAQHVMPGVDGPEGVLHSHDYRLEVVLERETLDDRGMVCDLDVLDAVLEAIDKSVRDRNLDEIRPADAEAMTVEVFARWAHDEIAAGLTGTGIDQIGVRIYENADAFGGYSARRG